VGATWNSISGKQWTCGPRRFLGRQGWQKFLAPRLTEEAYITTHPDHRA
jgi:hypothetical protein